MDHIIWDDNDDPNQEEPWIKPERDDLRKLAAELLERDRPDRYEQNDVAWMADTKMVIKERILSSGDSVEQLADREADRLVMNVEGHAKSNAARFFRRVAGQMVLGEGTSLEAEMLYNARNLPVKINSNDVVRIGALKQEDYDELRNTRDNEKKLLVDAADEEINGIVHMYGFLRANGIEDLDSLF